MTIILYIVRNTACYLIMALQICFFVRCILSFVAPDSDGPISRLAYAVTEPVIYPVRCLIEKIPALDECPIDISFTIAYLLLAVVQGILIYAT